MEAEEASAGKILVGFLHQFIDGHLGVAVVFLGEQGVLFEVLLQTALGDHFNLLGLVGEVSFSFSGG